MRHFFTAILLLAWMLVKVNVIAAVIGFIMLPLSGAASLVFQSGSACSNGAASLYFNPASMAEISRTCTFWVRQETNEV
jgi:hypothetical protein